MGVGADDQFPRCHKALLWKEGVLDAHASSVVEVGNAHLLSEAAHPCTISGGLDVLVGGKVVHDQNDLVGIKHLLQTIFLHFLDSNGGSDVAPHHKIQLGTDQIPCVHLLRPAMAGEDFLSHGHSHKRFISFLRAGQSCFRRLLYSSTL